MKALVVFSLPKRNLKQEAKAAGKGLKGLRVQGTNEPVGPRPRSCMILLDLRSFLKGGAGGEVGWQAKKGRGLPGGWLDRGYSTHTQNGLHQASSNSFGSVSFEGKQMLVLQPQLTQSLNWVKSSGFSGCLQLH